MELLVDTLVLRPYVFAFLVAFLAAGAVDLGCGPALRFAGVVSPLAWLAEFASTRWGVPFGLYHYTGDTRGRELFVANVPLMDSLSFTFLAYAAFCLARAARRGRRPSRATVALTAGALMMLLDVVIDPAAVLGDRWFLGRVFYYAEPGVYFGVPLANFAGWWLCGTVGVGLWIVVSGWRGDGASHARPARGARGSGAPDQAHRGRPWPGVALYYAVLVLNLAVTAWIGEWLLLAAGVTLHAAVAAVVFGPVLFRAPASPVRSWEGGIGGGAQPPAE